MTAFTDAEVFSALDYYSATDVDEILSVQSLLFINPVVIRAQIMKKLGKGGMPRLSRIATLISVIGPNSDASAERLINRNPDQTGEDKVKGAMKLIAELSTLIRAVSEAGATIRGTQFQAAFPDLIYKSRVFLIKTKNWMPQRFVDPTVFPLKLQFPGAGALIPESMHDGYIKFMTSFSKTISRGLQEVNLTIVNQSLAWKIKGIDITDETANFDDSSKRAAPMDPNDIETVDPKTGRGGSGQFKTGGSATTGNYAGAYNVGATSNTAGPIPTAPPAPNTGGSAASGSGKGGKKSWSKAFASGGFKPVS